MAFQGMCVNQEGHAMKVVFPYGGRTHEVHLPPCSGYQPESDEGRLALQGEAAIVLQCLTSRAALEARHALAVAGLAHVPCMDIPAFASEPHGSLADLVQQLQECVHWSREDVFQGLTVTTNLLRGAAALGHTSAAQQLLLISPRPAQPRAAMEAIRLLLQLAPELASIGSEDAPMPLHVAAGSGCCEAARLLLDAAPQAAAAMDGSHGLPLHWAAAGGSVECLRILQDAGAPGLDVPDEDGHLPLHRAARADREAAARFLLAAHPAAALVEDNEGWRPLQLALQFTGWWEPPVAPNAARALLPVSGLGAQQLLDLLAAVPAEEQPAVQAVYADVAACMPLNPTEWQQVPTPCPSLGNALPTVLARSEAEAALLVTHLPPPDQERLQTAALSLHRAQRALHLDVPPDLLGRMLALSLSDP